MVSIWFFLVADSNISDSQGSDGVFTSLHLQDNKKGVPSDIKIAESLLVFRDGAR